MQTIEKEAGVQAAGEGGRCTGALQEALERGDRCCATQIRLHRLRLIWLHAANVVVDRHLPVEFNSLLGLRRRLMQMPSLLLTHAAWCAYEG